MPLVLGGNVVHGKNEPGPDSDYPTTYQHTRTVLHYDTHDIGRIVTIGRYNDGH